MKVSVIIPAYNAEKTIAKTIKSVLNQNIRINEIIVVDDGSTDKTYEIAKRFRRIKVFKKKNGGESSALNVGIKHAKGDFIAIAESDVIIPKNWAKKLMVEFKDPDVWGVGGILKTANTKKLLARLTGYEHEWRYTKQKSKYVNHITSANLIYRKKVFKKLGLFDETLINSCLDADINNKITAFGKKLVLRKDVAVKHFWYDDMKSYIKRHWAYGYFRPRLKNSNLYQTDKLMMFEVSLTLIFIFSLLLIPITTLVATTLFIVLIIIQMPLTIRISVLEDDISFLLFPLLAILRDTISAIGYLKGTIDMRKKS